MICIAWRENHTLEFDDFLEEQRNHLLLQSQVRVLLLTLLLLLKTDS